MTNNARGMVLLSSLFHKEKNIGLAKKCIQFFHDILWGNLTNFGQLNYFEQAC